MLTFAAGAVESVAVLGAHCDDIPIGVGGTLLSLCRARLGVRVDALVLSGGGTPRGEEEAAALRAFCPGADLRLTVLDLPDGRFPAHWERVKTALEDLRSTVTPDLILTTQKADAHQDHRLLAELVPTAFRGVTVLGYEIVKWDGDLGRPGAYQPLTDEIAQAKVDLLHAHYPSQAHRDWFDPTAFLGLARIRGIECGARYAEAFYTDKITLQLAGA